MSYSEKTTSNRISPEYARNAENYYYLRGFLGLLMPEFSEENRLQMAEYAAEMLYTMQGVGDKKASFSLTGDSMLLLHDCVNSAFRHRNKLINPNPSYSVNQFEGWDDFRELDPFGSSYYVLMESTNGPVVKLRVENQDGLAQTFNNVALYYGKQRNRFTEISEKNGNKKVFQTRNFLDAIMTRCFGKIPPNVAPFFGDLFKKIGLDPYSNTYSVNTMPAISVELTEDGGRKKCRICLEVNTDQDHPIVQNYSETRKLLTFEVDIHDDDKINHENVFNWQRGNSDVPILSTNKQGLLLRDLDKTPIVKFSYTEALNSDLKKPLDVKDEDFEKLRNDPLELLLAAAWAVHQLTVRGPVYYGETENGMLHTSHIAELFSEEFKELAKTAGTGRGDLNRLQSKLLQKSYEGTDISRAMARVLLLLNDSITANPQRCLRNIRLFGLHCIIPNLNKLEDVGVTFLEEDVLGDENTLKLDAKLAKFLKSNLGTRKNYREMTPEDMYDVAAFVTSHPLILNDLIHSPLFRLFNFGLYEKYFHKYNYGSRRLIEAAALSSKFRYHGKSDLLGIVKLLDILPSDMAQLYDYREPENGDIRNQISAVMNEVLNAAWDNLINGRREPFACTAVDAKTGRRIDGVGICVNGMKWDAPDWDALHQHAEALLTERLKGLNINSDYIIISSHSPCEECVKLLPGGVRIIYAMKTPWGPAASGLLKNSYYWKEAESVFRKMVVDKLPPSISRWMFGVSV